MIRYQRLCEHENRATKEMFLDQEWSSGLLNEWYVYGWVMRIKFNKEIRGRGSERREPTRHRQREICTVNRPRTVRVCWGGVHKMKVTMEGYPRTKGGRTPLKSCMPACTLSTNTIPLIHDTICSLDLLVHTSPSVKHFQVSMTHRPVSEYKSMNHGCM